MINSHTFKLKKSLPLTCVAFLAGICVLVAGCSEDIDSTEQTLQDVSQPLPESLPVVRLSEIEALIAETAEQDRILVVDFWATWCVPCVAMFPDLHAGLKAIGDDKVRTVSITLDAPGEYEQQAIQFLAKHDALKDAYLLSEVGADQVEVMRAIGEQWRQLVVPAVFVFNHKGEIVGEYLRGPSDVPAMLEQVRTLIQ